MPPKAEPALPLRLRFQGRSRTGCAFCELADDQGRRSLLHVVANETVQAIRAIVQMDDMEMLAEYCAVPVPVEFGLEPGWARKILTVCHDAVRGEWRSECHKLLKEITIDGKSVACDRRQGRKERPRASKDAHIEWGAKSRSCAPSTLSVAQRAMRRQGRSNGSNRLDTFPRNPGRSRVRWSRAADRRPTFTRTHFTRTSRPLRHSHRQAQVRIKRGPTSDCYRPDPLPPRISSARSRSVSRSATA